MPEAVSGELALERELTYRKLLGGAVACGTARLRASLADLGHAHRGAARAPIARTPVCELDVLARTRHGFLSLVLCGTTGWARKNCSGGAARGNVRESDTEQARLQATAGEGRGLVLFLRVCPG